FDGSAGSDQFGWSVSGVGDVNGDGVPDILVGSPFANPGGLADAGRATVFSGSDGTALLVLNGPNPGAFLGYSVSGVGDVDGDGAADVIVGAPALGPPFVGFGTVRVFSGASGTTLFTFSGSANNTFGESVAGAGDMDGDLVPDLVVGWPIASPPGLDFAGQAKAFSGATGATLLTITGSVGDGLGSAVAGAGDTNGDGFAEVIVAAESADPPGVPCCNAGRARVLTLAGIPPGSSLFGSGCAGSGGAFPAITTSGGTPASAGNQDFRVHVGNALGGAIALLVAGLSNTTWNGNPLPLNLGGIGVPACSLFVSPDFFFATVTSGTGAGDGIGTVPLPVPANPALAG
ncbi:MAG TPA: integrin alpha, partial [Planctomycetota bacterium]|nr:integrin alpha [Planctomycetota bacterium]